MDRSDATRREFVTGSAGALGGAWLWLSLPSFGVLASCAREAARTGASFEVLTGEEGAALHALASRILPSDDGVPGAEEAGAAWFVDAALKTHFPELLDPVRSLLVDVDRRARETHAATFITLDAAQQDAIITAIEQDPRFAPTRMLVIAGVLSDPSHGGNRNDGRWQILGYRHEGAYQPPFGYYDAEAARAGGAP